MFCRNCGKQISDDAKFCSVCGAPQEIGAASEETTENQNSDGFNFHQWIIENSLEAYEDFLIKQDLNTLDVIMTLSESDLDKIGIESIGAKKKILNGIQKLKTTASTYTGTQELATKDSIPNRCPNCGEIWGIAKENTGAGNTLGKALIGGLLLGPIGVVGGAAFGNKTVVYMCNKCGFRKEYKSSLVKGAAKGIKDMLNK